MDFVAPPAVPNPACFRRPRSGPCSQLLKWLPLLLLALALTGCRRYNSPPELVGMWQTDESRYAGKFLQFDEKYVIIGFGDESVPRVQRIVGIKKSSMGVMRHYDFELRDEEGVRDHISLQYLPNDGGQIELSHPAGVVWKKVTPPPSE